MRTHVLLCDHAQIENNKLFISGAGISNIGPGSTTALAILIYIPWTETNRPVPYTVTLETEDGRTDLPSLLEDKPFVQIEMRGHVEVGRPSGAVVGAPLEAPIAIGIAPLPVQPGRYVWRLAIDNETHPDWTATFTIRSTDSL